MPLFCSARRFPAIFHTYTSASSDQHVAIEDLDAFVLMHQLGGQKAGQHSSNKVYESGRV